MLRTNIHHIIHNSIHTRTAFYSQTALMLALICSYRNTSIEVGEGVKVGERKCHYATRTII